MPSLNRIRYGPLAKLRANTFVDNLVLATYTSPDGATVVFNLRVRKRDTVQEVVETDRGWQEEEQTQIVIGGDQSDPTWGTVPKVRLFGTFLIGDDPVAWAVDGREGRGVETHSETFIVVHLYRVTQEVSGDQSVRRQ